MKWFKHYHNADTSHKLSLLIEEHGKVAYAEYWLLLELLCEKYEDPSDKKVKVEVTEGEICRKIRKPFPKKMKTFLKALQNLSLLDYEVSGKTFKFEAPILWKLKQKDYKRERLESYSKAKKSPLREKREEKREKREDNNSSQRFAPDKLINLWNDICPPVGFAHAKSIGPTLANQILESQQLLPSVEDWKDYFEKITQSKFCLKNKNIPFNYYCREEVISRFLNSSDNSTIEEIFGELMGSANEN